MKLPGNTAIPRIKKSLLLFIVLILFCLQTNENARAKEVEEYAIKAAFVFNFAKFTQWPETAFTDNSDPYQLCFIGGTTVEKQFNAINGKKIGIRTLYVNAFSSVEDCEGCDIIFISKDTDRSISEKIISKVKTKPVLTIGESEDFTKQGGMINFFSKEGRLQFKINPQAAKNQGLKLSSRLLKLAVIEDGRE